MLFFLVITYVIFSLFWNHFVAKQFELHACMEGTKHNNVPYNAFQLNCLTFEWRQAEIFAQLMSESLSSAAVPRVSTLTTITDPVWLCVHLHITAAMESWTKKTKQTLVGETSPLRNTSGPQTCPVRSCGFTLTSRPRHLVHQHNTFPASSTQCFCFFIQRRWLWIEKQPHLDNKV